jgi:hypothetical protein
MLQNNALERFYPFHVHQPQVSKHSKLYCLCIREFSLNKENNQKLNQYIHVSAFHYVHTMPYFIQY